MADGSLVGLDSLQGKVSEEEWNARVDLAERSLAVEVLAPA